MPKETTVAEAEEIVATETDIFQQQKKTIDTLMDVLAKQGTQPDQPVYVQTAAEPATAAPKNYISYILVGAVVAFLFLRSTPVNR